MKALEILKNAKGLGFTGKQIIINKYKLDEAIKEIEALEQSNKDLLNTIIEAQEVIKNVLEGKK